MKYHIADKFSDMYKRSRYKAGVSQEEMAKRMGVSKKTIQNWEDGTSRPSDVVSYEWFNALCEPPQPYMLEILYPDLNDTKCNDNNENDLYKKKLLKLIEDMPPHMHKKLYYILSGEHGSSPTALIDMLLADVLTPLRDRLNICKSILINYHIAEQTHTLVDSHDSKPNINGLDKACESATKAVILRKNSYINILKKGDDLCEDRKTQ